MHFLKKIWKRDQNPALGIGNVILNLYVAPTNYVNNNKALTAFFYQETDESKKICSFLRTIYILCLNIQII